MVKTKMTLAEIKEQMEAAGSIWWTPGAQMYLNRQVEPKTFCGDGGIYIITSEQPYGYFRKWTLRRYHPDKKCLQIMGAYRSLSKEEAVKLAKKLATGAEDYTNFLWNDSRFLQY